MELATMQLPLQFTYKDDKFTYNHPLVMPEPILPLTETTDSSSALPHLLPRVVGNNFHMQNLSSHSLPYKIIDKYTG